MKIIDLKNRQFGRLTVIERAESKVTTGGNVVGRWLCRCVCGKEKVVSTSSLMQNKVKSCGCFLTDDARRKGHQNRKHGGYSMLSSIDDQIKFQALKNIHERSKRRGYESDLELEDLPELTDFCPVLGIKYKKGKGTLKNKDLSPSIDRKNPNLPYLKKYSGNLVFISHRANRIKSDANLEELQKIIDYMGSLETVRIFSNGLEL